MPRVTLTFDLPDEATEFRTTIDAAEYQAALVDIDRLCRNVRKYGEPSDEVRAVLEQVRNLIPATIYESEHTQDQEHRMTDETKPHDSAAMPPASAGCHGSASRWDGVPVAWAAVGKNGVPMWLAYHRKDAEGAVAGAAEVVPLYRSPALTDEEREAIEWAINKTARTYDDPEGGPTKRESMRRLLERMS